MTVNIILRGDYFGVGKSHTALSYSRPGVNPVRLNFDGEYRDETFKSPDNLDHPELSQFAFDFWHKVYGDFPESLVKVATEIRAGKFPYNIIVIDDGSIFQDDLDQAMHNKSIAERLAKATNCYEKHENFLKYRFNTTDAGAYYNVVKGIIRAFLRECRKHDIDVIVTSETRNVWENYGSRDREKKPTILGQTAKLWDPWFQMADAIFVLERFEGDRRKGEAKMTPWPTASLDTFNTKISIPGVLPKFVFKDWGIFWSMADKRRLPTQEEYAKLEIAAAVETDDIGLESNIDAKNAVLAYALDKKFITSRSTVEKERLIQLGKESGLDADNVLSQYYEWLEAIDNAMEQV